MKEKIGKKDVSLPFRYDQVQLLRVGGIQFDRFNETGLSVNVIEDPNSGNPVAIRASRYRRNPDQTTTPLGKVVLYTDGRIKQEGVFDLTPDELKATLDSIDIDKLGTDSNPAPSENERRYAASKEVLRYQLVLGMFLGSVSEK